MSDDGLDVPDFGQFLTDEQQKPNQVDNDSEVGLLQEEEEEEEEELERERLYEEQRRECILRWDLLVFPSNRESDSSVPFDLQFKSREGKRRFLRESTSLKLVDTGTCDEKADDIVSPRKESPTFSDTDCLDVKAVIETPDATENIEFSKAAENEKALDNFSNLDLKRAESSREKGLKAFTGKLKGAFKKNQRQLKEKTERMLRKFEDSTKTTTNMIQNNLQSLGIQKKRQLHFFLFDDALIWGEVFPNEPNKFNVIGFIEIGLDTYIEDLSLHPKYTDLGNRRCYFRVTASNGNYVDIGIENEDCKNKESNGDETTRDDGADAMEDDSLDLCRGIKESWTKEIADLIHVNIVENDPIRMTNIGWKHKIQRGTLWSYAFEGNYNIIRSIISRRESEDENDTALDEWQTCNWQNLNIYDEQNATPLHYAAYGGHADCCKLLLANGADPNTLDNKMMTPLHYSALTCNSDVCRALLDGECDYNMQDLDDRTALALAVVTASITLNADIQNYIQVLGSYGVDTECRDISGDTSMHAAASLGSLIITQTLLSIGANLETRNRKGRTVLHALCDKNGDPHLEILGCVLTWGANPNAVDDDNNTALHLLLDRSQSENDRVDVPSPLPVMSSHRISAANLLAGYGARGDIPNNKGVTANQLAVKQNLNLSDASKQWKDRSEPTQSIAKLCSVGTYPLPFATSAGHANWSPDDCHQCQRCNTNFTFTRRKHHCRRCGKLVCGSCLSKSFTLCPRTHEKHPTPVKVKVCDSCFNSLCRMVTTSAKNIIIKEKLDVDSLGGDALKSVLGSSDSAARNQLFGTRAEELVSADEKEQRFKNNISGTGAVARAAEKAKETLVERGERLGSLATKTEGLEKNASDFASIARKLRQQEERNTSWFGLF